MKRVYLLLTLFIASFFFVSIPNVFAASQIYQVPENELSILTSNAFLSLREEIIEFCNANNKKYIIACSSSSSCYANIFDEGKAKMGASSISGTTLVFPSLIYSKSTGYKLSNNSLSTTSTAALFNYFYTTNSQAFTYISLIDTNVENLTFSYDVELVYKDFVYEVPAGAHFPSLYEFNEVYSTPTDRFLEDREVINNFYTMVLEKIVLLSNYFVSNFFLMLILGIFILIFIFEIIRRRII